MVLVDKELEQKWHGVRMASVSDDKITYFLGEQVVHQYLSLNHAAMFAVVDAECCHHSQMNGLLGTERFF